MKSEEKNLASSIIMIIFGLCLFIFSGFTLFLAFIALMIPTMLMSIFKIKNYRTKLFYPLLLPIFVIQGLLLIYTYLLGSQFLKNALYFAIFCLFVFAFISFIMYYAYSYQKEKYMDPNEKLK